MRVAIPARLKATTARLYDRRAEFVENLGTRDPAEAKQRAPEALARITAKLSAVEIAFKRGVGQVPTEAEAAALAALFGRREEALYPPGENDRSGWDTVLDGLSDQVIDEATDPETGETFSSVVTSRQDKAEATALLNEHDMSSDGASVERVAVAVFAARVSFAQRMRGEANPDTKLTSTPACTFDALLVGWAMDRGWRLDTKPIPVALYERQRTLERFGAFVGHRDASAVSKNDAVGFKESMQERGRHASTIRNDLSELSAIWTHGERNGKVASNPFRGVSPPKAKRERAGASAIHGC